MVRSTYEERMQRFRVRLVARALRIAQGDVRAAAELLGLNRCSLYDLIHRCGLKSEDYRAPKQPKPKLPKIRVLQRPRPQTKPRKTYFGVDVGT